MGITVPQTISTAVPTGSIKRLIDAIVSHRSNGNPIIAKSMRTKLMLKGINPDNYTTDTPDDPMILKRLNRLAQAMGVSLSAASSQSASSDSPGNVRHFIGSLTSRRFGDTPDISWLVQAR
jgi:hypothetical protein